MSATNAVTRDINTFSAFISQDFSWNLTNLVSNFGPVIGIVLLYVILVALGFYSTCIDCSVNKIVLLATYVYAISIYFLQKEATLCKQMVSMATLSLFSLMPLLIFVFSLTAPLWSGFGLLFKRQNFAPSFPLNLLGGLMSMFTGLIVYRVAISYSMFLLRQRICNGVIDRNIWTLWH